MSEAFSRTEILVGPRGMAALEASTVAVFGLGGVGSYAAEALARSGIGGFFLVDNAAIGPTNINRQIIATRGTVGRPKVEVMRERIFDINPAARVEALQETFEAETAGRFLGPGISFVIDAIDTISAKIALVLRAKSLGLPIVSAMGAGNKLDPTRVEVADIFETEVCPLARVLRRELRRLGVEGLEVVYSKEAPLEPGVAGLGCRHDGICVKRQELCPCEGYRAVPGSVSFVPPAFGLAAASVVVRALARAPTPGPSQPGSSKTPSSTWRGA
jgi:tRNA A37 threonylcarbamoyladenosine dehydratase